MVGGGGLCVGAVRERGPGELRKGAGNPLEPPPLRCVQGWDAREHAIMELVRMPVDPVSASLGHRGRDEDCSAGRAARSTQLCNPSAVREEVLGRWLTALD